MKPTAEDDQTIGQVKMMIEEKAKQQRSDDNRSFSDYE